MNGTERIVAERERQVAGEGWTPEHDDQHINSELATAARCYTEFAELQALGRSPSPAVVPIEWPWDYDGWKPADNPVRNFEKAAALIAAEIDRLLRASAETEKE